MQQKHYLSEDKRTANLRHERVGYLVEVLAKLPDKFQKELKRYLEKNQKNDLLIEQISKYGINLALDGYQVTLLNIGEFETAKEWLDMHVQ